MADGIEIGSAWVSLTVSAKGISKDVERELRPVGDEAEKASKKAGDSFDSIGTKALLAATAGGAALFGLASAAGDLEAAISANEQVLGDASAAVQAFAQAGVENVGLSETAVLNAATSFGQLGKIIGLTGGDLSTFSTDLVTLSADLAAFANVPASQALEDLQSAFAGQPEVMRKYGIFLDETTLKQAYFDETGIRVTGTLTAQQRLIATNAELWRQSGDIQGQAAREADSFARKLDDLKATVSNVAADFGAPIVGFAADLLEKVGGGLTQLSEWNTETGGMLATGVAAGIGIATAAAAAAGVGSKVRDAVKWFRDLSRGMQIATGVVGGVALAVTAGFVAYGLLTQRSREVEARTREVQAALGDATAEAWEYAEATGEAGGKVDGFAVAQHALSIALTTTGEEGEALVQALGQVGAQSEDAFSILFSVAQDAATGLSQLGEEAGLSASQADLLAQAAIRIGDDWPISGARAQGVIRDLANEFGMTTEEATNFISANYELMQGLEGVQNAAEAQDLNDLATQFLNNATAASEDAEALIDRAKAAAEGNDVADSSIDTFNELQVILAGMSEEERQAAQEALGLADAHTEVTSATSEANEVAATSIDMVSNAADAYDRAAGRVDAFRTALDRLINPIIAQREAQDEFNAGLRDMAQVVADVENNVEGATTSLYDNSDAADENRRMVEDQVTTILDYGQALIENGESADHAANSMATMREQLIQQLIPFAGSRKAAADYIDMLGLTPDNIQTAVEIYGQEAAKQRVEDHLAELGNIPENERTNIEALIDQGDYAAAEDAINKLARDRSLQVYINAVTSGAGGGRGGGGGRAAAQAHGAYLSGPEVALRGEDGDEWVAPLTKMADMRRWLAQDRIRGPVLEALDFEPQVVGVGGGRAPLVGEMHVYESTGSSVEEQLTRIEFRRRVGV